MDSAKTILLENTGHEVLVDAELFDYLNQWKWYENGGYAVRTPTAKSGEKRPRIAMHRLIADTPYGLITDHINRNKLDNRKSNLRICTIAQNGYNKEPVSKSGVKGVWFDSKRGTYIAHIAHFGKKYNLGRYKDIEDAILARDAKAKELQGEYAYLNGES